MATRKLQGPLGGDYQTDGAGNAVLLNSYPLTQEDDVPQRLADHEARVTAAEGALARSSSLAGLRWAFLGDSITNGSVAGNFSYSVMPQAVAMAGGLVARVDSIESGVPGNKATDLLARVDTLLAAGPEAICILIGTNDAGNSVSLADFSAAMTSLVTAIKAAGLPVVVGTPPPRGSGAAESIHKLIQSYALWEKLVLPSMGVTVVDTFAALADASGYLASGYDSGDGVHPNATGHNRLAVAFARGMRQASPPRPYPFVAPNPINSIADVLNARTGPKTSPWFEQPGGTGTAPSYSMVDDTSGKLPAGRWAEMDFDGSSNGGTRRLSAPQVSVTAGDAWLLGAYLQIKDGSDDWVANVIAATAACAFQPVNQSGATITGGPPFFRCPGLPDANVPGIYDYLVLHRLVIPVGATAMNIWFQLVVPTGSHATMRVGLTSMVNLTANGLESMFPWGSAPVNIPA